MGNKVHSPSSLKIGMKRASESPYSGQRSMLQEKDNDLQWGDAEAMHMFLQGAIHVGGWHLRRAEGVGGPPSEHSSSGSSLTMWCHPVSSAVSYMISRVPGKCSLLPVPQRAWEKTRLLSLGSRGGVPWTGRIRTYFPITVPFHSLMRKPNIFSKKKKKERNLI